MPVCRIPAAVQWLYRRGLFRAPAADRPVYLTFDDGPHPVHSPAAARILADAGVTGHFFITGERAREYPGIVREIAAAGHVIGCHGEKHTHMRRLAPAAELENYLEGCATLHNLTGRQPSLVRPPHGRIRLRTARALERKGCHVILYDVIPYDYLNPAPETVVRRVAGAVRNGSIILLHDGGGDRSRTVAALPGIIAALGGRYRWGRLDRV